MFKLLLVALLLASTAAQAIPTLVGSSANATGVSDLMVGGNLYDVSFIAQSYNSVYPADDAPFLGDDAAATAATNVLGAFLTNEAVTGLLGFACTSGTNQCRLSTPSASFPGFNVASGPVALIAPFSFGDTSWHFNSGGYSAACVGIVTGGLSRQRQ